MTDLGIAGIGDATVLASGGSALVYRAETDAGEMVAVKVLRGIRGDEVHRRFRREQSAADRLGDHDNIVAIKDHGITVTGEPYLVMPLMRRGSLADELERDGSFRLEQALADVSQAADAIDYAHSRGVLHRDLKPGNLLRRDEGTIAVTDFGIARVVDAGISSATISAATPLYAAPELLADNEATAQSDVYALGALLYALLAGKPAFSDSANLWGTIHRVRTESPPTIEGIPAPIMATIAQAMAKDPAERPTTARRFRDHLATAIDADPSWRPPAPAAVTLDAPDLRLAPAVINGDSAPYPLPDQAAPVDIPQPPADPGPSHTNRRFALPLAAVATVLVAVGALGWWMSRDGGSTDQVLAEDSAVSTIATEVPVDSDVDPGSASPEPAAEATEPAGVDPAGDASQGGAASTGALPATDRLVRFNGNWFSAYFPDGWSVARADIDQGYGYRSDFVADQMTITIDTTPAEQRTSDLSVAQSAREIAAAIRSATPVETEVINGLETHWFRFRNGQGHDTIDIFFEVDGDGYAILASSPTDPQAAFAVARQVATTIRSNQ